MLGDSDYGWGEFNEGGGGYGAARLEGDGQYWAYLELYV